MINTFIAYDNNDFDFGEYFEESHGDIHLEFQKNALIVNISINGLNCTEQNVNNLLNAVNKNRFVFIALSHGNEDEFWSHEIYISTNNASQFINSFLYSTACLTGKKLSKILIENGCSAFIGYTNEVNVLLDYKKMFYTCENYGIKSFLATDETIETSYNKLVDGYTTQIDLLYAGSIEDLIVASVLIGNRDSLVLAGNATLTRNDFNLQ